MMSMSAARLEPGGRATDAEFDVDLGLPAEFLLRLGGVEAAARDVAGLGRTLAETLLPAERVGDHPRDGVHVRLFAGGDVPDAGLLRRKRFQVRLDDVVDVDEVARLPAAAEDLRPFPVEQHLAEDADDAALPFLVLARAVDVGVAQGRVCEAEMMPRGEQVV